MGWVLILTNDVFLRDLFLTDNQIDIDLPVCMLEVVNLNTDITSEIYE